jgi:hypothetical protein
MFDPMHLQDFDEGFFGGHFHRGIPFNTSRLPGAVGD